MKTVLTYSLQWKNSGCEQRAQNDLDHFFSLIVGFLLIWHLLLCLCAFVLLFPCLELPSSSTWLHLEKVWLSSLQIFKESLCRLSFSEGSPNTQVELRILSSRSHCSCPGTSAVIQDTVIVCLGPGVLGWEGNSLLTKTKADARNDECPKLSRTRISKGSLQNPQTKGGCG